MDHVDSFRGDGSEHGCHGIRIAEAVQGALLGRLRIETPGSGAFRGLQKVIREFVAQVGGVRAMRQATGDDIEVTVDQGILGDGALPTTAATAVENRFHVERSSTSLARPLGVRL